VVASLNKEVTVANKLYSIIRYDCTRDREGGYEVNDAHRTGQLIELDETKLEDDKYLLKVLRKAGWFGNLYIAGKNVQFDLQFDGSIEMIGLKAKVDRGYRPLIMLAPFGE
jgi:hypothetical protein